MMALLQAPINSSKEPRKPSSWMLLLLLLLLLWLLLFLRDGARAMLASATTVRRRLPLQRLCGEGGEGMAAQGKPPRARRGT
jgi:hypothetical protein